ncbi:hypothetical protein [Saliphagus sp. LR7]|uniref:hypothetical protein n=1 Tax=Saliphagus sp. LR7 TaxID=2282654 RepID=UPI0013009CFF|nr:hypothetical protein [Saliphagus sp. LR7]
MAVFGGLGIGVVDAQENESNETADDGFGADPNEGTNVSIDFGEANQSTNSDDDGFGVDTDEIPAVEEDSENNSNGTESADEDGSGVVESAVDRLENGRDEGLSQGRDLAEEHIPGGETAGDIYDSARAAEETISDTANAMRQSPGEWFHSLVVWAVSALLSEIVVVINAIHEIAVQVPAPGEATDPSSWTEPESEQWQTVFAVISWPIVIAVMWLIAQFGISFSYESAEKRRRGWKRVAFAGLMVFGTFAFAPALLHLFAELAAEIYPDGEEFATPEGGVRFGLGVLLLLGLLVAKGVVVVAALVAVITMHFLTYLSVLFWPLSWAAWASHGQARAYGSFGLYILGVLLALSTVQSLILRFLVRLPLGESIAGTAGSLILIVFGIGFALVYLPWKLMEKAHVAAALKLGREPTERVMQNAPAEVHHLARHYRQGVRQKMNGNENSTAGGGSSDGSNSVSNEASPSSGSKGGGSESGGSSTSSDSAPSEGNGGSSASPDESTQGGDSNPENRRQPLELRKKQTFSEMRKDRIDREVNS